MEYIDDKTEEKKPRPIPKKAEKTPAAKAESTPVTADNHKPTSLKPWIAAGFKSRAAWRASKGQKTAPKQTSKTPTESDVVKAEMKAKVAAKSKTITPKIKAKSKAKVTAKLKTSAPKTTVKSKPKPKIKLQAKPKAKSKAKTVVKAKGRTPAEKRAAKIRTANFRKILRKRDEPNENEKKMMFSVKVGKEITIQQLGDKTFKSVKPAAKRYLMAKNGLRWVVAKNKFKKVRRGTYKRIAK